MAGSPAPPRIATTNTQPHDSPSARGSTNAPASLTVGSLWCVVEVIGRLGAWRRVPTEGHDYGRAND